MRLQGFDDYAYLDESVRMMYSKEEWALLPDSEKQALLRGSFESDMEVEEAT